MKPPSLRRTIAASLVVGIFAGCGDGDEQPTEPTEPDPQVTTVTVTPDSAKLTEVGATQDFDATVKDQNGDVMSGVSFEWSISDTSIASIGSDGTVEAKAEGTVQVEATAEGVTGSSSLAVDFPEIDQVRGSVEVPSGSSVSPSELTVATPEETESVGSDGSFTVNRSEGGQPLPLFLGTSPSEVSMLAVSFGGAGDSVKVSPTETARALVIQHPAMAGAPKDRVRQVYDEAPSQPSFDPLVEQVKSVLSQGSNLYSDLSIWGQALEVLEDVAGFETETIDDSESVRADRVLTGVQDRSDDDPNIVRDSDSGTWSVTNPRPIYWSFRSKAVASGNLTSTLVQPAAIEWEWSEFWYQLTPTTTDHGTLSDGLHNALLVRGLPGTEPSYSDFQGAKIRALFANGAKVLLQLSRVVDIELVSDVDCFISAGVAAADAKSQTWQTIQAVLMDGELSDKEITDLLQAQLDAYMASECIAEAVAERLLKEAGKRAIAQALGNVTQLLNSGDSAQLGWILAALIRKDAFASELALREIKNGGGQWSQYSAVKVSSDPTGATLIVDGREMGPTPIYLINLTNELSEGSHDYQITKGDRVGSGSFTVDWGTWAVVEDKLTLKTGSLKIAASTSGEDQDSDGYTVAVGSNEKSVDPDGSVTFKDLEAGEHEVELSGIQSNCSVDGSNPRTVNVEADETTSVSFSVTCSAQTGDLKVEATTTGEDQDADGYTVTVDGSKQKSVFSEGEVLFEDLSAGEHEVELSGIKSNCSTRDNPRTVNVEAGQVETTTFVVDCESESGAVFSEDWESGDIDSDTWRMAGSPSPHVESPGNNSEYSLDVNGDSWCDSGVLSTEGFSLGGRSLIFQLRLTEQFSDFQDAEVGFEGEPLTDDQVCDGEGYTRALVRIRVGKDGDRVFYQFGSERFETSVDDAWHTYRMKILESGRVEFYKDGSLVAETQGTIDLSVYSSQSIQVVGRSHDASPVLIDNIQLIEN